MSQNHSGQREPLQADGGTDPRYWIREDFAIVDIGDKREELGQRATEVKIAKDFILQCIDHRQGVRTMRSSVLKARSPSFH